MTCRDSDPQQRHPPEHMIDMGAGNTANMDTWWQSKSWYDYPTPLEANITFSFDKQYELRVSNITEFPNLFEFVNKMFLAKIPNYHCFSHGALKNSPGYNQQIFYLRMTL